MNSSDFLGPPRPSEDLPKPSEDLLGSNPYPTWIAHYIGHNISQHIEGLVECILLLSQPLKSTMWFNAFPAHFTTRSLKIARIHREWPSAFLRRDALDRLRVATARVLTSSRPWLPPLCETSSSAARSPWSTIRFACPRRTSL